MMSEKLEDLLNEDVDDFSDIGKEEEEALLQDNEDIFKLDENAEEEHEEDQKRASLEGTNDFEEKVSSRKDKFAIERQRITAPSPDDEREENSPEKNDGYRNNRGRGGARTRGKVRGGFMLNHNQNRPYQNRPYMMQANQPFKRGGQFNRMGNKKVLINPRFQGIVPVNNNARLVWDPPQNFQHPPNPWADRTHQVPPVQQMQHMAGPPMYAMQQPPQFPPQLQPPQFPPQLQPFQGGPPPMQAMETGPVQMCPSSMQNVGYQQYVDPQQQQRHFMPQGNMGPIMMPHPQPMPHHQMLPPGLPPNSGQYWGTPAQPLSQDVNHQPPITYHPDNNNYEPPQLHRPPPHAQPHYNPQQTYCTTTTRDVFAPNRKVAAGNKAPTEKRFIRERLGQIKKPYIHVNNVTITPDDRRVVKNVPFGSTVTVMNVTKVKIEEDEETRDLRHKIEEQRRKREEVLKWKEARRLERLQQQNSTSQQVDNQMINAVVQRPVGTGNIKSRQSNPQIRYQPQGQNAARPSVLQPIKQVDLSGTKRNSQFVASTQSGEADIQLDEEHLSQFLAERKVLAKDVSLMETRRVTIRNISTSTGEKKLFQICKGIGEVQKLHRDINKRHATVTFKSVSSAHAFFKKYQRHMLDLSMIEVSLAAETDEQK